jgi:hypothetical protein
MRRGPATRNHIRCGSFAQQHLLPRQECNDNYMSSVARVTEVVFKTWLMDIG